MGGPLSIRMVWLATNSNPHSQVFHPGPQAPQYLHAGCSGVCVHGWAFTLRPVLFFKLIKSLQKHKRNQPMTWVCKWPFNHMFPWGWLCSNNMNYVFKQRWIWARNEIMKEELASNQPVRWQIWAEKIGQWVWAGGKDLIPLEIKIKQTSEKSPWSFRVHWNSIKMRLITS